MVGGGLSVSTVSYFNASCFELKLGLGFSNNLNLSLIKLELWLDFDNILL